jgi:phage gpG-like protein
VAVTIHFDFKRALNPENLRRIKRQIAILLQEQTIDRIEASGDDEIQFKSLPRDRPNGSRTRPLYDTGSHLLDSITNGVDADGAWVGSTFEGAKIHQFGTVGADSPEIGPGTLPTIRPVRAKALFIPLTPRAQKSVRVASGPKITRKGSGRNKKGPVMFDLVPGVDFIFLKKSDVPPRPFLRVSRKNAEEIAELFEGES